MVQTVKKCPQCSVNQHNFIINKRITSGIFLSIWKYAKVKPLHKSGAKYELNNYRLISILPTLSKIIEKWTHSFLMSYLNQHQLLNQKQIRFRLYIDGLRPSAGKGLTLVSRL